MEQVLKLLSQRNEIDFTRYKPSTIKRRLEKRMEELKIASFDAYLNYIKENSEELDHLFSMVLIGVTEFFRDKDAYEGLSKFLKKIISNKKKDDVIRIWSVGCATGEEAYSIAILLSKILKERISHYKIQVFATDINHKALKAGRSGIFPESSLKMLSAKDREMFFNKKGKEYEVKKFIRQMMLFSRHDIISDPPFVKLDLITCRNLFIYFDNALQQEVISIFHYALNPNSYLCLGKSENLGQLTELFSTVDRKHKIFQRKRSNHLYKLRLSKIRQHELFPVNEKPEIKKEASLLEMAKDTIFNTFDHPFVVINDSYDLMETHGDVRLYLGVSAGTMNANILKMINKELRLEFRTLMSKVLKSGISLESNAVGFNIFGEQHYVKLAIKPILYSNNDAEFYLVIFEKVEIEKGGFSKSKSQIKEETRQRILELEHELAAAKEHLQNFTEELEFNYEELQSLNEELQSVNEELKSSNEELETSNEELHSSNEELFSANAELEHANENLVKKEQQIGESEARYRDLFDNAHDMIQSVRPDGKFEYVNKAWLKTLGYTKKEVQKLIVWDIIHPSSVKHCEKLFQQVMSGRLVKNIETTFVAKDGSRVEVSGNATVRKLGNKIVATQGIFHNVTENKMVELALQESEERYRTLNDSAFDAIIIGDAKGKIISWNMGAEIIFGYKPAEIIGKLLTTVMPKSYRERHNMGFQRYVTTKKPIYIGKVLELEGLRKNGEVFPLEINLTSWKTDRGQFFSGIIRDITERKNAELALKESEEQFKNLFESAPIGMGTVSLKGKFLRVNQSLLNMMGYSEQQMKKMTIADITHPDDIQNSLELIKKLTSGKIDHFQIEKKHVAKNGKIIHSLLKAALQRNTKGEPIHLIGQLLDITESKKAEQERIRAEIAEEINRILQQEIEERKKVELALKHSEAQFRSLAQNAPVLIIRINKKGDLEYINRVFPGFKMEELIGSSVYNFIDPSNKKIYKENLQGVFKTGKPITFEVQGYGPDRKIHWYETRIAPIKSIGKIDSVVLITSDITENKNAQEEIKKSLAEKEVLLKEVHHRVKNNLQIVSSLLNLQADTAGSKELASLLRDSQGRIRTMSVTHESLYQRDSLTQIDLKAYIAQLIDGIIEVDARRGLKVKLDISVPEIYLQIDTMVPIGLMVNELVTNSLKHAFVKRKRGCINVSLKKAKDKEYILSYSDDGIGLPKNFEKEKSKSLGMELIDCFVEQLEGKISLTSNNKGLQYSIRFKS
ncbi:MAG: hypothetical protein COA57_14435 [Flavobacteriales bacterium]|nr:MAG: hypothetical protein COA57_14435 [Flavobacteriales bacterium]